MIWGKNARKITKSDEIVSKNRNDEMLYLFIQFEKPLVLILCNKKVPRDAAYISGLQSILIRADFPKLPLRQKTVQNVPTLNCQALCLFTLLKPVSSSLNIAFTVSRMVSDWSEE